jgi:hypothetical protein
MALCLTGRCNDEDAYCSLLQRLDYKGDGSTLFRLAIKSRNPFPDVFL